MAARGQGTKYQGSKWLSRTKRLAIYLRDGVACVWCGEGIENGATLTLDHLKPHCQGGTADATNLVTACRRCNSSRGERSRRDFAEAVSAYLGQDTDAEAILKHIRNCTRRQIATYHAQALALISRRGSYGAALEATTRSN